MTLLCRHGLFGLLSCRDFPMRGPQGGDHPAQSVLRIDKLLLGQSALSMLMTRFPSHSKKTERSRPCQLLTTQGIGRTVSDLCAVHQRPRVILLKSFGSCPRGGSVGRILRTTTPSALRSSLHPRGLCRLLTKGTGAHGRFNDCGCRKR